jgi:hypothetical protein
MPKADKKQRREAKRKAKRLEIRRRESVSPIKRLADAPGTVECWASGNFDEMGQINLYVYKQGAGLSGVAAFLVDRGVVGLKDAFVRMNVDREQIREMIDEAAARMMPMHRVGVEEVRRWVAGGIRWAHDNGMRLPKDWHKPASFIGGVGDWPTADVSQFVKEFAGHPEDLRQRLIGEPMETFLKRSDIRFILSSDAPYMEQRTGQYHGVDLYDDDDDDDEPDDEELDELMDFVPPEEIARLSDHFVSAGASLSVETTRWLTARNEAPSAELADAWMALVMIRTMTAITNPSGDAAEVGKVSNDMLKEVIDRFEPERREELVRAIEQVKAHMGAEPQLVGQLMQRLRAGQATAAQDATAELPQL